MFRCSTFLEASRLNIAFLNPEEKRKKIIKGKMVSPRGSYDVLVLPDIVKLVVENIKGSSSCGSGRQEQL